MGQAKHEKENKDRWSAQVYTNPLTTTIWLGMITHTTSCIVAYGQVRPAREGDERLTRTLRNF